MTPPAHLLRRSGICPQPAHSPLATTQHRRIDFSMQPVRLEPRNAIGPRTSTGAVRHRKKKKKWHDAGAVRASAQCTTHRLLPNRDSHATLISSFRRTRACINQGKRLKCIPVEIERVALHLQCPACHVSDWMGQHGVVPRSAFLWMV